MNRELRPFLNSGVRPRFDEDFVLQGLTMRDVASDRGAAIELATGPDDGGVAWLRGADLTTGSIEIDVRSAKGDELNFLGLAFHANGEGERDLVYLRPFLFQSPRTNEAAGSVQYMSSPNHPWQSLREEFPGGYETRLDPEPAAGDWVRLRVDVEADLVRVFVDERPVLQAPKLGTRSSGRVGLWLGFDSRGQFANWKVTSE